MSIFKCKMCGGTLEISADQTTAVCEYCGTEQTLSKSRDEVVQNLFNRANNLRLKAEFDKAQQVYEKIVSTDGSDAEAYWGLVLCKYGIEYVEEPSAFKRVPTCHRTQVESVLSDVDYLAALENATLQQKALYEKEAREIDRLQKDILKIAGNEKPFDVFICYKESDNSGRRAADSVIANDIYHQLTQEGFKVFYAAITLEDKLGQEYEPYIFAALNSAKVMLAIGTKPEYFTAVWVRNEWSRYLKLMKADRSRLLIPCYKDMDAYDLPEEFSHLQAQDMGKIGFINDVVRGIKKVIRTEPAPSPAKQTPAAAPAAPSIAPLLKRAFMYLEDGAWQSADEYCEKVLDIDPENAEAYLGKLMAELKCEKREDLKHQKYPFDKNGNYAKVMRFCDHALKEELQNCIAHINERNEQARLEGIYQDAVKKMQSAKTELECKAAAAVFSKIPGYKDADSRTEECQEKAEITRKDAIYYQAQCEQKRDIVFTLEAAIAIYEIIPGWKDADALAESCRKRIAQLEEEEECRRIEQERREEAARQQAIERAKRNKKIATLVAAAAVALTVVFLLVTRVFIPLGKYNSAVNLMENGQYEEAISAFGALGDYRDSNTQIEACRNGILQEKYGTASALLSNGNYEEAHAAFAALGEYQDSQERMLQCQWHICGVGDTVLFGSYHPDAGEYTEWLVLEVKDGKALLISKDILDCVPYNTSWTSITWENCTLRDWLNGDFMDAAFTAEEQSRILLTDVSNPDNPWHGTDGGSDTQDYIFLLSIEEANRYFSSDGARQAAGTAYAKDNGLYVADNGNSWWWLRSPGYLTMNAAYVYSGGGGVSRSGRYVDSGDGGVRPALWIDLES